MSDIGKIYDQLVKNERCIVCIHCDHTFHSNILPVTPQHCRVYNKDTLEAKPYCLKFEAKNEYIHM